MLITAAVAADVPAILGGRRFSVQNSTVTPEPSPQPLVERPTESLVELVETPVETQ